jgi:hypothetical protein
MPSGVYERKPKSLDRLWLKIVKHLPTGAIFPRDWLLSPQEKGCWEWVGGKVQGYGFFHQDKKFRLVHRVIYELLIGKIPETLVTDHLCRTRHCCNPTHLEMVTSGENSLRGFSFVAINARKTHCKHGHEFTPENTIWSRSRSGRDCRECQKLRSLKWQKTPKNHDRRMGLQRLRRLKTGNNR